MKRAKLTSKYQVSIPKEIREILNLGKRDSIGFELIEGKKEVKIFKLSPIDREYLSFIETTLEEWKSEEDEYNFKHLQEI